MVRPQFGAEGVLVMHGKDWDKIDESLQPGKMATKEDGKMLERI